MSMSQAVIPLEEGWKKLREGGVLKIQEILEDLGDGQYSKKITTDEYSSLYTTVYTMCTQKPPNNWSENLYQNYCEAIKDYLSSRILPHIKEKHDESMLKELVRAALPARVPTPAARARRPADVPRRPSAPAGAAVAEPHADDPLPLARLQVPRPLLRQAPLASRAQGGRRPELPRDRLQRGEARRARRRARDGAEGARGRADRPEADQAGRRDLRRDGLEPHRPRGARRTAPPARRTARTPPPRLLPRLAAPLLTAPLLLPPSPGVRHRLRGAAAHHHRRLLLARVREVGRGGLVPRLHGEGGGSNPGPTCTSSTSSATTHPPPTTHR